MDVDVRIDVEGLDELERSFRDFPRIYKHYATANLTALGGRVIYFCRQELADVRYTGALEQSFTADVDSDKTSLTVYPRAKHAAFVRPGTRPHWAPIEPLKRWAAAKLGDERAAYPVRWSIRTHGTSMYQQQKRGTKANPWPLRVVARGDFATAMRATAERLGKDLAAGVVGKA